jgi:hypothetical protein
MMPMPLFRSEGSASRSTPVMVNVFPLLVCPYARIVQLNPSVKREIRGSAVLVKSECWVTVVGWTWSNVKTCFFPIVVEGDATAVAEPEVAGVAEEASTVTLVEDVA